MNVLNSIKLTLKEWASYLPGFLVLIVIILGVSFLCRLTYSYAKRGKALYEHIMNIDINKNSNSITVPDSCQVYIIQPNGEQETIIIGDPNNVKVKPRKK